ncbi:MAG TPA: O-antigen ligase family protein [Candidatus Obscuribacter sp.]|nr:O-antigen ligase family protein [Candidatus Obscuribacter sp.]
MLSRLSLFLTALLALSLSVSLTLSWVVLLALMAVKFIEYGPRACWQSIQGAPFFYPLLAFISVCLLSGLWNGGPVEGLASFSTTRALLIYAVGYLVFACEKDRKTALAVFLTVAMVAGFLGVIQQLFNVCRFTRYPYLQATGFLSSPMSFAGVMQLTSFLALGLLLRGSSLLPRSLLLLVTIGNFLGLIFAAERSAWLGMFAGILILTWRMSRRSFLLGIVSLVVATALSYSFVPVVKTRLNSLTDWRRDVSITARLQVWQVAWTTFNRSPWLGVGPRNFPRIENEQAIVKGQSSDLNHGHSNYMHILATTGVLGILTYLVLVLYPFFRLYKAAAPQLSSNSPEYDSGLYLGLLAALASLMVAGIFEYNFGAGSVRLAQWFCLAFYRPPQASICEKDA